MQHYKKPVRHFVDPLSKNALYFLLAKEIKKLNKLIQQGACRNIANRPVKQPLQAALFSPDQNLIYPVIDEDIPCLLITEALPAPKFKAGAAIDELLAEYQSGTTADIPKDEIGRLKSVLGSALSVNREDNHSATHNKLAFLTGHLGRMAAKGARILDISSGNGQVIENCCNLGHRVFGIDTQVDRARKANERLKISTSHSDGDFQLCIADARHLPFPDHVFDAVLADFAQQSPDDIAPSLSESARVTKKNNPLLAGFSVESRLLKPLKPKAKLSELPYSVKVMLSVVSAAGLTPFWWVYGMAKASDTYRYADMREIMQEAAIYSYSAMFNVKEKHLYPRQLVELFNAHDLVRESSFDSVQIGTNRWFLLKSM